MECLLILLGIVSIFILAIFTIIRMMYHINKLKYELKLAKITSQRDLDRLADKINQLANKDSSYYLSEVDKLDKLQKTFAKLIDSQIDKTKLPPTPTN